jgi:hypothetical protein
MGGKQPNPAWRGTLNPFSKKIRSFAGKVTIPALFIAPDLFAVLMAPFACS